MTDYYQSMLNGQLERAYSRHVGKKLPFNRVYSNIPEELRPIREFSKFAPFLGCLIRRKGYHLYMSPEIFIQLAGGEIKQSKRIRAECNERWEQGLPWKPFRIQIEPDENYWQVRSVDKKDIQAAMFLLDKAQKRISVQAFHDLLKPANLECLNSIEQFGLLPVNSEQAEPILIKHIKVAM